MYSPYVPMHSNAYTPYQKVTNPVERGSKCGACQNRPTHEHTSAARIDFFWLFFAKASFPPPNRLQASNVPQKRTKARFQTTLTTKSTMATNDSSPIITHLLLVAVLAPSRP